jgi:predicted nucleotidyltransferase
MKTFEEIKRVLEEHKKEIEQNYFIKEIGVFGSYVKNENTDSSDVDILVDFSKIPSLFKFVNLENYLSDLLGVKVDLVMKAALKPNIGKYILNEVIYL